MMASGEEGEAGLPASGAIGDADLVPNDSIQPIEGPELVVGLVGPVGTDWESVHVVLEDELQRVRYSMSQIRISRLMRAVREELREDVPEDERYETHMDAGSDFRSTLRRGDFLAYLAVQAIRNDRRTASGSENKPRERHAYVIRSLKHPDEVKVLRRIYGRAFHLVAVHTPRSIRLNSLEERIAESRGDLRSADFRSSAEALISRDEQEGHNKYGQRLRDTFPLADVFLDACDGMRLRENLRRYIRLVFGHPFETPTVHEYAMFHAFAAALRSADLSRQVGAVIAAKDGSLLAAGCNEVPRSGGGTYWPGDHDDGRDFQRGFDPSAKIKRRLLKETLGRLRAGGLLKEDEGGNNLDTIVDAVISDDEKGVMKDARLMDLLEFGRVVHAEMHAISEAAARGISVQDKVMYCTTFSCHMCARHIVASGIKEVHYIEPYPKSMAKDLYPDSIAVDEPGDGRVEFRPFTGIAPRRYMELFTASRRKGKDGRAVNWTEHKANPTLERFVLSYLLIEMVSAGELESMLHELEGAGEGVGHDG